MEDFPGTRTDYENRLNEVNKLRSRAEALGIEFCDWYRAVIGRAEEFGAKGDYGYAVHILDSAKSAFERDIYFRSRRQKKAKIIFRDLTPEELAEYEKQRTERMARKIKFEPMN